MKLKLLLSVFLITFLNCFSQKPKLMYGKVVCNEMPIEKKDVVNLNSKKSSTTDSQGNFTIEVSLDDVLFVLSKDYYDRKITITSADLSKEKWTIALSKKPVELEEIEIERVNTPKGLDVSYNDMKMAKIQKDAERPKNRDVYTGEIENGVDFVQIAKMIGKLFKKKKPKNDASESTLSFKEYALANFYESFYTETLKLEPSEIFRFLDYCQADPNSILVIKANDELKVLEFLILKKEGFDKLK